MQKLWRSAAVLVVGVAIGVGLALLIKNLRTSESDRVEEAATSYLQAFADNDPASLCASISPLGRTALQLNSQTCEQSAKTAIAALPKGDRDALHNAEITSVSVSGNNGSVKFTPKLAGRDDMKLVKLRDVWFVNP
jgi:hypothetical protein